MDRRFDVGVDGMVGGDCTLSDVDGRRGSARLVGKEPEVSPREEGNTTESPRPRVEGTLRAGFFGASSSSHPPSPDAIRGR